MIITTNARHEKAAPVSLYGLKTRGSQSRHSHAYIHSYTAVYTYTGLLSTVVHNDHIRQSCDEYTLQIETAKSYRINVLHN